MNDPPLPSGPDEAGATAPPGFNSTSNDQTIDYRAAHERTDEAPRVKSTALDMTALKHFGRYEVRELLGRGGLGEVYIGYDPQLDRKVAIKVPRVRNASAQQSLLKEARHVAQFSHPGIVAVYDVGIHEGQFYIVSELLDGISLEKWLRKTTPDWMDACRITAAIADALAYAHARRTVHRDIKPDNIVLKVDQAPVLIDFGLAINDETSTLEQVGLIAGTFHYMSPEQASGLGHRIDGRTDIYSLGVVFYRMLTARIPFHSTDRHELLRQVKEDAPQPPRQLLSSIPATLEAICLKAMAKNPDDRFTTAVDFARDLRSQLPSAHGARPSSTSIPHIAAKQAERRQVTVVYCRCDLFDSPEFLENFDPEDQHELLSKYQQICDRALAKFGGTVVQATGQDLLVCCGYPISFEDAAHRAIRLSLAIRDDVLELGKQVDRRIPRALSVAIGIHTGIAVVEEKADSRTAEKLTLAGEARTVATQLQGVTHSNSVTITQGTRQLVRGFFVCESLGTHTIKGTPQPIELYRVIGESEARDRLDAVEAGGLTPLIGRELELSVLKDRWEKATDGTGQAVLMSGEPGLGKSRLVRELRDHVAHLESTSSVSSTGKTGILSGPVIEWRCSPYFQNTDLYPAIDALERILQFTRDDVPAQRFDRLLRHLENLHLADAMTVPLFAALLSLPPDPRYPALPASPQRLKELTQEALLDWLRAIASKHPLLLIVEDLHWIDPSTLQFLSQLVEQVGSESILVLLTYRPEFEQPLRGKANQTELALSRLSRRQVTEMMERKTGLKMLPPEIVAQILERTDGVPLFIEEFTQVLLESGSLRPGEKPIDLSAIPSSLQDLLMARLDRLECLPEVTQMSAVLGREFSYEWLQATLELDEPVLQAELAKLVKAGILFQKGRPPRSSYTFKHALLQDAAYQSLLRKKRQQFHKKFAEVLESRFPERAETGPELLAHHFSEGGDYETGVRYWQKAGLRAQARFANPEAISHLSRGLEILDEHILPSKERDALELGFQGPLGVVLTAVRGWGSPEVAPTIERARELCDKVGSVTDRFFVLWGVWGFRLLRLELDKCRELATEAMALLEGSPNGQELIFEAHWLPGCTAFYAGEFATALKHFEEGWALFNLERSLANSLRTGQNVGVLFQAHIAVLHWEMGFPEQALAKVEETVRFARGLEHPFSLAMALYYRRRIYQACGLQAQVEKSVDEEISLCQGHGFAFWLAHALFAKGDILIRRGEFIAADGQLQPIYQMIVASGCKCSVSDPYAFVAESYLRADRLDEANEWLTRGFDLVNNHNERCLESELLRLRGEHHARSGRKDEAEQCLRQAAESARARQAKSRELRALTSLLRLKGLGDADTAAKLAGVLRGFTEGLDTADLREARRLLTEQPAS